MRDDFDHLLLNSLSGFNNLSFGSLDNNHLLMSKCYWLFNCDGIGFLQIDYLFLRDHECLLIDDVGFMDIEIVINRPLFNVICSYYYLFLNLYNVKLGFSKYYGLGRNFNYFCLFLNEGSSHLLYLNGLSVKLNNLFSLNSLNIDLYYGLFIKYRFLSDDFNWNLNLNGDLNSLLNRYYLSDLDNSINKPVNINLDGLLFNNLNYFLSDDFWIRFRLDFDDFSNLLVVNLLYNF